MSNENEDKSNHRRTDDVLPDLEEVGFHSEFVEYAGPERRRSPHRYEIIAMLHEELESRDQKISQRLEKLVQNQDIIKNKIQQWETGAQIVRWITIFTVGALTAIAGFIDWAKEHFR